MGYLSGLQKQRIRLKADGQEFEVDLLPVRFFGEYLEILTWAAGQKLCADTLVTGRKRLRELIEHVWDPRRIGLLNHFDYEGMANLARVLFFGEDTRTAAAGGGKTASAEETDLELAAGRIMHLFPAYDLEKLLDLSLVQFLELNTLAIRIQADEALNVMIPAVGAGMGSKEIFGSLQKIVAAPKKKKPAEAVTDYTQAEYDEAVARLKAVNAGKGRVIQNVKAGMRVAN